MMAESIFWVTSRICDDSRIHEITALLVLNLSYLKYLWLCVTIKKK